MAGYVVDNEISPNQLGEDSIVYTPTTNGEVYYILSVGGEEVEGLDRYPTWESANYAKEAQMNGLGEVDSLLWEVVEKTWVAPVVETTDNSTTPVVDTTEEEEAIPTS